MLEKFVQPQPSWVRSKLLVAGVGGGPKNMMTSSFKDIRSTRKHGQTTILSRVGQCIVQVRTHTLRRVSSSETLGQQGSEVR